MDLQELNCLFESTLDGIEGEIEMENDRMPVYTYNGQKEHTFMLRQLESAANDSDSPITYEDVDVFRNTDDIYSIVLKVIRQACRETQKDPEVAAYVVICSIFSSVMHTMSNGYSNTEVSKCSLVAAHPVTFSAIEGSSPIPQNSEEFRKVIESHVLPSKWLELEADATRETLKSRVKAVKRFSKYLLHYQFETNKVDEFDNKMLPCDFQNKEWVRRALTALRQFGSDAYKSQFHRFMAYVRHMPNVIKCNNVSIFVKGVLKEVEDAKNGTLLRASRLYDRQLYSLAMRFAFILVFPAFHVVHHSVCDSEHAILCSFDAPWNRFIFRNTSCSRLFIRLAVASFAAHHMDKIIENENNSNATNITDIPRDIWESCIMIPHIVSPLLAPPRKRYSLLPESGVRVEIGGVYSGQVINSKTIRNIQKKNVNGALFLPARLRHRAFVPQTHDENKLWSEDDGMEKIGYFQDVKQIKNINAIICILMLVCKTWNKALSKYNFKLTAHIDNFSESASDLHQSPFLIKEDIPPLPTILKSRAASITLVLERSVPVSSTGAENNNFHVCKQIIPTSTLFDAYTNMDVEAIGGGRSFSVEFAKRLTSCVSTETMTLAVSNNSAKLWTLDEDTEFLVPVMNANATTTVCPLTFRCKISTTSLAAAREVSGPRSAPLPLALKISLSGIKRSMSVKTQQLFVVSERVSAEARKLTSEKRKIRTENERQTRKASAHQVLYM